MKLHVLWSVGVSGVVVCSTPQDTVLSPFLFSLYTSDFRYNYDHCHMKKFSDDYHQMRIRWEWQRIQGQQWLCWLVWDQRSPNQCQQDNRNGHGLQEKVTRPDIHTPVSIQGKDIETVDSYLGVHLSNKLEWNTNTEVLYKKGQSCFHLLRRLGSWGDWVCRTLLKTFYDTFVAVHAPTGREGKQKNWCRSVLCPRLSSGLCGDSRQGCWQSWHNSWTTPVTYMRS